MSSLFSELRRRNVFKVGAVYVLASWLIVQVVDVLFPAFQMPPWTITFVASLLVIGFPLALILAWAFELTPQGLKRSEDVMPEDSVTHETARRLNYILVLILLLAVIFFVLYNFISDEEDVPGPSTGHEGRPSVAVLPLENMSRDPVNDPFTVGVHDDLLTHISKISSIKTISRTSVLQYRSTTKTIPEIAAELGVATVLEGGVQRVGDRVRINVQLIDAVTDEGLWAETYDRQLTAANIFAIQSEIAKSIAVSLKTTLSPEETQRIDSVPTQSLDAYEAYLLGNQRLAKRTVRDLEKAAEHFEVAIRHDPDYALAWVGLANSYTLRAEYGGLPRAQIREKVGEALAKAFSLDDSLAAAYAGRGLLALYLDHNERAARDLLRAIELEPNLASAYHWYAELLKTDLARPEEAADYFEKALALDPKSAVINAAAGTNMHMLGQFDSAFALNNRAIGVDLAIPGAYWGNGTLHWSVEGDLVKSVEVLYTARHMDPRSPNYTGFLSMAYLDMGDIDQARQLAAEAISLGPNDNTSNLASLWIAAYAGDGAAAGDLAGTILKNNPAGGLYANPASTLHPLGIASLGDDLWLAFYERAFPEMFGEGPLEINRRNYRAAIDLAGILSRKGNEERAEQLLSGSGAAMTRIPRLGWFGYGIADAEIFALRGQNQQAIEALRKAVDEGWRLQWWSLDRNPNLAALHDAPEVRGILNVLTREMAQQLEAVRRQRGDSSLQ
jgi:TolB-like protein